MQTTLLICFSVIFAQYVRADGTLYGVQDAVLNERRIRAVYSVTLNDANQTATCTRVVAINKFPDNAVLGSTAVSKTMFAISSSTYYTEKNITQIYSSQTGQLLYQEYSSFGYLFFDSVLNKFGACRNIMTPDGEVGQVGYFDAKGNFTPTITTTTNDTLFLGSTEPVAFSQKSGNVYVLMDSGLGILNPRSGTYFVNTGSIHFGGGAWHYSDADDRLYLEMGWALYYLDLQSLNLIKVLDYSNPMIDPTGSTLDDSAGKLYMSVGYFIKPGEPQLSYWLWVIDLRSATILGKYLMAKTWYDQPVVSLVGFIN